MRSAPSTHLISPPSRTSAVPLTKELAQLRIPHRSLLILDLDALSEPSLAGAHGAVARRGPGLLAAGVAAGGGELGEVGEVLGEEVLGAPKAAGSEDGGFD